MNFVVRTAMAVTVSIGVAVAAFGANAQDAAEDLIKSRQSVMRIFASSLTGLGNIAQGKVSQPGHMAAYANALAAVAATLPDQFPAGTGPDSGVKTRALPAIWDDAAGFEQVLAVTSAAVADLVAAAESGDVGATGAALGNLGKNGCGACHTNYRTAN